MARHKGAAAEPTRLVLGAGVLSQALCLFVFGELWLWLPQQNPMQQLGHFALLALLQPQQPQQPQHLQQLQHPSQALSPDNSWFSSPQFSPGLQNLFGHLGEFLRHF